MEVNVANQLAGLLCGTIRFKYNSGINLMNWCVKYLNCYSRQKQTFLSDYLIHEMFLNWLSYIHKHNRINVNFDVCVSFWAPFSVSMFVYMYTCACVSLRVLNMTVICELGVNLSINGKTLSQECVYMGVNIVHEWAGTHIIRECKNYGSRPQ